MKQKVFISGMGGQGVVFLTQLMGEAALLAGLPVISTETHGMAQRGGLVISYLKVGGFPSPLIKPGTADLGLFLHKDNLLSHGHLLKPGGLGYVNTDEDLARFKTIDGLRLAQSLGRRVLGNLILLGFAVKDKSLFAGEAHFRQAIKNLARGGDIKLNLKAFELGLKGGFWTSPSS